MRGRCTLSRGLRSQLGGIAAVFVLEDAIQHEDFLPAAMGVALKTARGGVASIHRTTPAIGEGVEARALVSSTARWSRST